MKVYLVERTCSWAAYITAPDNVEEGDVLDWAGENVERVEQTDWCPTDGNEWDIRLVSSPHSSHRLNERMINLAVNTDEDADEYLVEVDADKGE